MKNLQMIEDFDGGYTVSISGTTAEEARVIHDYLFQYMTAKQKEETWEEEILRRARAGENKIQCIKRVRELTGWGLKEAKDCVDEMHRRYQLWPGVYSSFDENKPYICGHCNKPTALSNKCDACGRVPNPWHPMRLAGVQ